MSKENTELQKVEDNKESFLRKTAIDTTSKTLSTGLVEWGKFMLIPLIPSLLGSFIGFLVGISIIYYIPLCALVFCLVAVGRYYLFVKSNEKILTEKIEFYEEKERVKNGIENLKEQIEIIKIGHQNELSSRQQRHLEQINGRDSENKRLKGELQKNDWLVTLADKQRNKITNYILVEILKLEFEMKHYPRIILPLKINDWSVFDITLEDDNPKGGITVFVDNTFYENPFTFAEKPSYKIYTDNKDFRQPLLKREDNKVDIEQRLSDSDINNLNRIFAKAEAETDGVLVVYNLTLKFKVNDNSQNDFFTEIKLQPKVKISRQNLSNEK